RVRKPALECVPLVARQRVADHSAPRCAISPTLGRQAYYGCAGQTPQGSTGAEITYNYGRDYLINVITRRGCKCDKCRKKRAAARAKARAKSRTSPAKPKKMGKKKCG